LVRKFSWHSCSERPIKILTGILKILKYVHKHRSVLMNEMNNIKLWEKEVIKKQIREKGG